MGNRRQPSLEWLRDDLITVIRDKILNPVSDQVGVNLIQVLDHLLERVEDRLERRDKEKGFQSGYATAPSSEEADA